MYVFKRHAVHVLGGDRLRALIEAKSCTITGVLFCSSKTLRPVSVSFIITGLTRPILIIHTLDILTPCIYKLF